MRTSTIKQPGLSNTSASSNSRVEANEAGWKPADRINSDSASRTDASSSTIMTSGCSASALRCCDCGVDLCKNGWSTLMSVLRFLVAQCVADGCQQRKGVEGFAKEPTNALGAALIGYLVATGDEEHGQLRTRFLHQTT